MQDVQIACASPHGRVRWSGVRPASLYPPAHGPVGDGGASAAHWKGVGHGLHSIWCGSCSIQSLIDREYLERDKNNQQQHTTTWRSS